MIKSLLELLTFIVFIVIFGLGMGNLIRGPETIDTILTDNGVIENINNTDNVGNWGNTFISTTKNGTMKVFDNKLYNVAIRRSGEKVKVTIIEKVIEKNGEITSRKLKLVKVEFIESGTTWFAKNKKPYGMGE